MDSLSWIGEPVRTQDVDYVSSIQKDQRSGESHEVLQGTRNKAVHGHFHASFPHWCQAITS